MLFRSGKNSSGFNDRNHGLYERINTALNINTTDFCQSRCLLDAGIFSIINRIFLGFYSTKGYGEDLNALFRELQHKGQVIEQMFDLQINYSAN